MKRQTEERKISQGRRTGLFVCGPGVSASFRCERRNVGGIVSMALDGICEGFDFETQDFEALGCLLLERTAGDCRVAHATPQQSTGSLLRHGFFLPDGLRYAIDEL